LELGEGLHQADLVIFDVDVLGADLVEVPTEFLYNFHTFTELLAARVVRPIFVLL